MNGILLYNKTTTGQVLSLMSNIVMYYKKCTYKQIINRLTFIVH